VMVPMWMLEWEVQNLSNSTFKMPTAASMSKINGHTTGLLVLIMHGDRSRTPTIRSKAIGVSFMQT